ncbi:MAG TPA: DCC1-like thiol-disulfide oxidoreductase family protein [Alphaproteobacteria bacterium]|nr:DCC1-like thiol-disulfide oxidoreductase family protein [Alphaproteobacteria bacterium]
MTDQATLIYDGDCPFCSRYARYVRLRQAVGTLRLVDARDGGAEVDRARRQGLRLDDRMVLEIGGVLYHGDACLNRLALMSSRSGVFNRVNYLLFKSPRLARVAYPALRSGRNLALRLLGRKPLGY